MFIIQNKFFLNLELDNTKQKIIKFSDVQMQFLILHARKESHYYKIYDYFAFKLLFLTHYKI